MTEISAQPKVRYGALPPGAAGPRIPPMPKSGPHAIRQKRQIAQWGRNYVKEWRVFRNVTVEKLSELTGLSTGNISGIENRRQGYSAESLEKMAHALRTTPAALLGVNPLGDDAGGFWLLWERANPQDRQTLKVIADRLIEASTEKK